MAKKDSDFPAAAALTAAHEVALLQPADVPGTFLNVRVTLALLAAYLGAGGGGGTVGMRVDDDWIQYRTDEEGEWINLIEVSELQGPEGLPGDDGTDGTNGTNGTNAPNAEMQVTGSVIQFRPTPVSSWIDLIDLATIDVGDVVGPAASTADAVALFNGNTGKLLKDGITIAAIRSVPQNSKSAAYTLTADDAGHHILHPAADATARTMTIPANAAVPYPIGTALTFVNQNGAGVMTIAITTDTMRLAGGASTGSRTLAANGIATALKIAATEWLISGTGLT